MPKHSRPRRGSLQYWPRKRAKRIYPRVGFVKKEKEAKPLAFAAWKAGMTHIEITDSKKGSRTFGRPISKPVTILDAPSLLVCGLRFYKKIPSGMAVAGETWAKVSKHLSRKVGNPKSIDDPRSSVREVKEPEKWDDVRLIVSTQPSKSGMKKKKPDVFEIEIGGEKEKKSGYAKSMLGKEINPEDVFATGEWLDVKAVTKGHGFTGPVKRFGIKIQTRKDQQHHRHAGSIGGVIPRKVDWRVPLPGQHGFHVRTEYCKRLMKIAKDGKINPKGGFIGYGVVNNYMIIEGSVPGPGKRLVILKKSTRPKAVVPVDIKYISTESKQGV
ncbi:MAG: 50S ribosomal protein L3 [Candidatus Aenigmarchaeota archaeon]|nr:50S ribosomal protein L3 [Candidatus Aenigmarchaeota archaeon]